MINRSALRFVLAALLASSTFPVDARAAAASWQNAPTRFVLVREDAPGDMQAFIHALRSAGGHVAVVYPPRAAVVFADEATLARAELAPWIAASHGDRIKNPRRIAIDPTIQRAAEAWNASLEIDERADDVMELPRTPDAGPKPYALEPEPPRLLVSDHMPYGAQYYDQSEYFAGSSAVGIWLLEAPAGASVHWSTAEENATIAGVQVGLSAWARKGGDGAFLTFFFDIHTKVPVSGTPIENPQGMDDVWANEVLTDLGYSGSNAFQKCYAYNESIRDAFDTNWAYSIFIVDSDPSVNQGLFSGGGYAWAYFGGPWIYMSRYSTWAYNSSRYAAVVPMHETGHIFYATDEYDGGSQQWRGYLYVPDNGASNPTCIMNRNDSTTVCQPTRDQLAWRDLDGDQIIEPLDTSPDALLDATGPTPQPPLPTASGSAHVTTIPNLNPASNYNPAHAITVATIAAVECRVDGGAWTAALAADGAFNGYEEAFTWTPSAPLADGVHVIEARAQSSVGNWTESYPTDTVTVNGLLAVAPRPNSGFIVLAPRPNPAAGQIEIPIALAASAHLRADVLDISGRHIAILARGTWPAGTSALQWNARDAGGAAVPAGVYLVRVAAGTQTRTVRVAVAR